MKTLAYVLALAADLVPGVTMVVVGAALVVGDLTDVLWH